MGQGDRGQKPLQAIVCQRQAAEKGRRQPQRVNRRADVVAKAGQREFLGAHPAAGRGFGFHHQHRLAGRASVIAAASPLGPEPMTMAS